MLATRAAVDRCGAGTIRTPKVDTANAALRGQKIGTSTGVGLAEYFELSSDDGRVAAGFHVGALAAGEG